jgi:hypothetical protein
MEWILGKDSFLSLILNAQCPIRVWSEKAGYSSVQMKVFAFELHCEGWCYVQAYKEGTQWRIVRSCTSNTPPKNYLGLDEYVKSEYHF